MLSLELNLPQIWLAYFVSVWHSCCQVWTTGTISSQFEGGGHMVPFLIQSGLNISESVILTISNNDTDLVGTNFFQCYLIRYSGKFVFQLRHNKTGNQTCYFLYNQYPLHWHLVKHASLLRKLHRLIALLYFIFALDRKMWLSVDLYERVWQRCSVSVYTS